MMRNLFRYITISAFFFASALLYAEEKPQKDAGSFNQNRLSIAYGFVSVPGFSSALGSVFGGIIHYMFSDIEEETYKSFGPLSITYDRNTSKHLSLGVVFAYENYASERTWSDGETEREFDDIFTLMLKFTIRWGWEVVSFYHGISVGAGLWLTETEDSSSESVSENYITPALHFYLLGINLKVGDTVSLFGDWGGGFLGMLNIGLAFNF